MKHKPQTYAEALVEGLSSKTDLKKAARSFWYSLQKNNQYRDLKKILNEIDLAEAKKEGKKLAKVYSEKKLSNKEIADISSKVSKKINAKIVVSNIIKDNWSGIVVEVDDKVIDLSTRGKIEKLSKILKD